jgi:hypothetical protein
MGNPFNANGTAETILFGHLTVAKLLLLQPKVTLESAGETTPL